MWWIEAAAAFRLRAFGACRLDCGAGCLGFHHRGNRGPQRARRKRGGNFLLEAAPKTRTPEQRRERHPAEVPGVSSPALASFSLKFPPLRSFPSAQQPLLKLRKPNRLFSKKCLKMTRLSGSTETCDIVFGVFLVAQQSADEFPKPGPSPRLGTRFQIEAALPAFFLVFDFFSKRDDAYLI